MGIGPIEAIPAALRHAGLTLDDLGIVELNEAFAAQALAVIDTLGLNPKVVNPYGVRSPWVTHWAPQVPPVRLK